MPRKGKPEETTPSSTDGSSTSNKYDHWRSCVQALLTSQWPASSVDVEEVAATVVGMFDAGATDYEVADFLYSQERFDDQDGLLTDEARMALARQLHRSAASDESTS